LFSKPYHIENQRSFTKVVKHRSLSIFPNRPTPSPTPRPTLLFQTNPKKRITKPKYKRPKTKESR
jgi:hypothetical protein